MNLKERLTSTEKLLQSIRSGEALSSKPQDSQQPATGGSIWTRPITLRDVFAGMKGRAKAAPSAPAPAATAAPATPAAPSVS